MKARPDDDWTPDKPLPNGQEEVFVLGLLKGLSVDRAAVAAGWSVHQGRRAWQRPHVKARHVFLSEIFLATESYDIRRHLRELLSMLSVDQRRIIKWGVRIPEQWQRVQDVDSDGQHVWINKQTGESCTDEEIGLHGHPYCDVTDSDQLTAAEAASIKKIKVTQSAFGTVTNIAVELHDRLAVLDRLGKMIGAEDGTAQEKIERLQQAMAESDSGITEDEAERWLQVGVHRVPAEKQEELRRIAYQGLNMEEGAA